MDNHAALSTEEITDALTSLPHWEHIGDHIRAEFTFDGFPAAMGFMTEVAIHADKANHHPEWSNVYNRVTVELTTHDSDGVTQYDIDLATLMSQIVARAGRFAP
jgi:4a-hydroxytetrahydrobiopterin dehydratase